MVPDRRRAATPCSSPATMKLARIGITAPFIVMETLIFSERDAVEEDLHVLDRVDGDAGLAHIAHDAGMVAVIAAVGGQIEGDRHALLPGRQRLAVEGVRSPRRWKSPHIAGSSRAARHTSSPGPRA